MYHWHFWKICKKNWIDNIKKWPHLTPAPITATLFTDPADPKVPSQGFEKSKEPKTHFTLN